MFKTFLIIVLISLSKPDEKSILIHEQYNTMEECKADAEKLPMKTKDGFRVAVFCVGEDDLLGIKEKV